LNFGEIPSALTEKSLKFTATSLTCWFVFDTNTLRSDNVVPAGSEPPSCIAAVRNRTWYASGTCLFSSFNL